MAKWDGKSKSIPLGYQIFISVMQMGGLRAAYLLLYLVIPFYFLFDKKSKQSMTFYLRDRMGFKGWTLHRKRFKNLIFFGQTLIDKLAVMSGFEKQLTITHIQQDTIADMLQHGKGGLLVGSHIGNWEAAGHTLRQYNFKVNVLMYDGESEAIKALVLKYKKGTSFNIISLKDDGSHIYEIMAALGRNELVCLHADRYRGEQRKLTANFLGKEAVFPAGPFLLGCKLGAPVSFIFANKTGTFTYDFIATSYEFYTGKGEKGMHQMMSDYLHHMTTMVKAYPEQWYNYYDFWDDDK